MTPAILTDLELQRRLRMLIERGFISLKDVPGGTGAPGKLLERELGLEGGGNDDTPDGGRWELKYHGGGSGLITLFHLEPKPSEYVKHLINEYGWVNSKGQKSFRHTIHGGKVTKRGFWVEKRGDRVCVMHEGLAEANVPYWESDDLMNSFGTKLRRMLLVAGSKTDGAVCYTAGTFYQRPRSTKLIELICDGTMAIEFGARLSGADSGKLRNHGTKLRIKKSNLTLLYREAVEL